MPEQRTESELLFDQYLSECGYAFESQPKIPPGKTKKMDDRVSFEGSDVYFDVTEFREGSSTPTGGAFDPYERIHAKLEAKWEQLNQYREYSSSLTLYNGSAAPVFLKPELVLGAMLGTLSYSSDRDSGEVRPFFGKPEGYRTGYMVDWGDDEEEQKPRDTPFSSIVVLEKFPIGQVKFSQLYDERERHREKKRSTVEDSVDTLNYILSLTAEGFNLEETALRLVVYENPYAGIPLPRGIFQGPYDQRWGEMEPGKIGQIFAGSKLRELEASLRSYYQSPLVRAGILKDK